MIRFNEALSEALFTVAAAACLPGLVVAQQAAERPAPIAVTADLGVVSRYLWRGYDLGQGGPAVQVTGTLTVLGAIEISEFASRTLASGPSISDGQVGIAYRGSLGAAIEWSAGYVAYLAPGESASGEVTASLSASAAGGSATLTYGRGSGAGVGNSVNLWIEREVPLRAERVIAVPYFQADYLDAYGLPPGFGERLTALEIGVPVRVRVGAAWLYAAASVMVVPSRAVRRENLDGGARTRGAVTWLSFGVSLER